MVSEFKGYLTKSNALALAIGVIIGGASAKLVSALVADVLMPIISLVMPAGDWREKAFVLKESVVNGKPVITAIKYGDFVGSVIDFVVIAFVVFLIIRAFIREAPPAPTKSCSQCLETVPEAAVKCRACGSPV